MADGRAGLSARARGKAAACWAPAATGPQAAAWAGAKEKRRGVATGPAAGNGPKERKEKEGGKRNFSRMVWSLGNFREMQMNLNSNSNTANHPIKICNGM